MARAMGRVEMHIAIGDDGHLLLFPLVVGQHHIFLHLAALERLVVEPALQGDMLLLRGQSHGDADVIRFEQVVDEEMLGSGGIVF